MIYLGALGPYWNEYGTSYQCNYRKNKALDSKHIFFIWSPVLFEQWSGVSYFIIYFLYIARFPTSTMLLGRVQEALCESGDGDTMVEVLQAGEFDASWYNQSYAKFMQSGKGDAAQPIILAAAEKFPEDGVSGCDISFLHTVFARGVSRP